MELQPVLLVGPDGLPVLSIQAADLAGLASEGTLQSRATEGTLATRAAEATLATRASETTLAASLAALQALPLPSTKVREVTIALTGAMVNSAVALGGITTIQSVVVRTLANGAGTTLRFGAVGDPTVVIAQGEIRENLSLAGLFVSCPGAAGGSLTLELHGR